MYRLLIGRSFRGVADILLNDETISPVHAEIILTDDGKVLLKDKHSTNGTYHLKNGVWEPVRYESVQLNDNDKVKFGRMELSVQEILSIRQAVKVFLSYSHKDEALWSELNKHISALKQEGIIKVWWDREVLPGGDWNNEVSQELEAADLIFLLISPDFLNSEFCYREEMRRAVKRHEAGTARVIPIILRPCYWAPAPFAKLQGLPEDMKPVTSWPKSKRDMVWAEVAKSIHKAADACAAQCTPGAMYLKNKTATLEQLKAALQDRSMVAASPKMLYHAQQDQRFANQSWTKCVLALMASARSYASSWYVSERVRPGPRTPRNPGSDGT